MTHACGTWVSCGSRVSESGVTVSEQHWDVHLTAVHKLLRRQMSRMSAAVRAMSGGKAQPTEEKKGPQQKHAYKQQTAHSHAALGQTTPFATASRRPPQGGSHSCCLLVHRSQHALYSCMVFQECRWPRTGRCLCGCWYGCWWREDVIRVTRCLLGLLGSGSLNTEGSG